MKFIQNILYVVFILISTSAYSQTDSLENRIIYNWKFNQYDLSPQLKKLDTSLTSFQNFNPLLKNTISNNYLGNLGSAAQSKIYYDRKAYKTNFIFSEPYAIYFHLPKEQVYYNTRRQFTLLNYSNAGPKKESEQILGVLHTQNISPDFNVGVDYDMISSEGRYSNQQIRQNNLTVFSSFKKNAYSIHGNFTLNRVKAQENGGIDSLKYLGTDEYKNRKNIPVKIEDASNQVLSTSFYLVQEYRLGKTVEKINIVEIDNSKDNFQVGKGLVSNNKSLLNQQDSLLNNIVDSVNIEFNDTSIVNVIKYDTIIVKEFEFTGFSLSHELIYNKNIRKYIDEDLEEPFYINKDIFIDSTETSDSVKQWQLGNRLSIHYKSKDKFSARLSFYNEQMTYKYNIRPDTTFSDTLVNPVQDTSIRLNYREAHSNSNLSIYIMTNLFNKFLFSAYGEYYISGYKKENSKLNLKFAYNIKENTEISVKGNYTNKNPDFFYKRFSSNHFEWNNKYLRMIEEWDAGIYIVSRKYKFDANVRYGQLSNYLYLDSTAYVNQYRGQINVLTGEISKRIKLGPINSFTRFVYQKSTNDSVLSIPKYNIYQSLYYERLFNFESTGGKLLMQFGIDYRFTSRYMADGYMPITGLFYRQFEHEQQNYHCFDVFVNFTVKTARFYIKYNYINSAINKKYYYTAPFYPSPEPVLKFGLAWTFYN